MCVFMFLSVGVCNFVFVRMSVFLIVTMFGCSCVCL